MIDKSYPGTVELILGSASGIPLETVGDWFNFLVCDDLSRESIRDVFDRSGELFHTWDDVVGLVRIAYFYGSSADV